MLRTVVAGVDGSEGARGALRWIVAHDIAEVHTVYAVSPGIELLEAGIQIDVTGSLRRAAELLSTTWVEGSGLDPERKCDHVIEDSPVRALVDTAHRFDADAIVVGASGHEHIDGLVGATIGRLVHVSDLPLVVVPPSWAPSENPEGPIVVAISGDPFSDRQLVDWARTVADGGHALRLVHAVNPSARSSVTLAELHDSIEAGMSRHMNALLGETDPNDRIEVAYDDPVSAIADASDGATMSVVGTHHSGRLGGFLTGAISQHLPAVSRCPVALIPLASPAD